MDPNLGPTLGSDPESLEMFKSWSQNRFGGAVPDGSWPVPTWIQEGFRSVDIRVPIYPHCFGLAYASVFLRFFEALFLREMDCEPECDVRTIHYSRRSAGLCRWHEAEAFLFCQGLPFCPMYFVGVKPLFFQGRHKTRGFCWV